MKLITRNNYRWGLIGVFTMLLILITVFITINKNRAWTKGPVLSRTDYRIFACGEELLLQEDTESLAKKRNSLFARSESGSIIVDGTPTRTDDVLEHPWPRCASHDDAIAAGELILKE